MIADVKSDKEIRDALLMELESEPEITSHDIAVAVKDGVVTLFGFVHSYWEKDAAERAAKRVFAVKGVANDIECTLPSERTDPEIARDAIQLLQSHVSLPADKIKVTVRKGWVTLEGSVDWQYQKSLAESAVKELKGVSAIANEIEIKPQVAQTEIQTRIEDALRCSADLDAQHITVEVVDGSVVNLYGRVGSWAAKDEAERAAWAHPGVTRVENYITTNP